MHYLPFFVRDLISSPHSPDLYRCNPNHTYLSSLAEGLAAGLITWEDGSSDSIVFYRRESWGATADWVTPAKKKTAITDSKGRNLRFTHIIVENPRGIDLGYFISPVRHPVPAFSLASKLIENKIQPSQDYPLIDEPDLTIEGRL